MRSSKIKGDNFYVTYGWMANQLKLKGTALQVFAIIYGFSQDGGNCFTGSLQYLVDFTNTSKPTVIKSLKELLKMNFIVKIEEADGKNFFRYRANLQVVNKLVQNGKETVLQGSQTFLPVGSKETLHNKKYLENKSDIDKEKIDKIVNLYHSICISYPRISSMSAESEDAMLARLNTYSEEDFRTLFKNAENSSFLKGSGGGWNASLDWLLKKGNFVKVLEGKYEDKPRRTVPGWNEPTLGAAEIEAIQRVLNQDFSTEDLICEA